jgi:CRISPR system Cascade subunit CasB
MPNKERKQPDYIKLYQDYQALKPGPKAELRRVASPDLLIEIPAFYRLLQGQKAHSGMQRLIYCLPCIKHSPGGRSLGQALANSDLNEKRLFMVIRSESPNDLIQLRRLLQQVEPVVDWEKMANQLWWWNHPNQLSKRQLLEDFFYYQNFKESA